MPPSASRNLPGCRSVAPVKAPFSWPNRIDSTSLSGHCAAIHRDEGLGTARAAAVDRARDQLLADAGFAFDQHRYRRGRRLFRRLEDWLHRRRSCDHVGDRQRAFVPALEPSQFASSALRGERIAQRDFQPFRACRLDHEIGRARAHGGHHIVDPAMGGLHDHRNIEAGLSHESQDAQPVEIGHHQVEDHGVDSRVGAGEKLDRRIAAVRDDCQVAKALDCGFKQATLDRIVVDDEHNFRHKPNPRTTVPNWCTVAGLD